MINLGMNIILALKHAFFLNIVFEFEYFQHFIRFFGIIQVSRNVSISKRKFHPWEGGEGKVTGQYTLCRVELAKNAIAEKQYEYAIQLLKETEEYPHNLGEGKLKNAEENEVYYYKGLAYSGLSDIVNANANFNSNIKSKRKV